MEPGRIEVECVDESMELIKSIDQVLASIEGLVVILKKSTATRMSTLISLSRSGPKVTCWIIVTSLRALSREAMSCPLWS